MARRLSSVGAIVVVLLLAFAPVALGVPSDGASPAQPGAVLDPSFGSGGLARVPLETPASAALGASSPGGALLVSGGATIQLLNGAGGTGEAFGAVGSLPVPPAAGREFVLGGFTLDPQGRLLVVGSSLYPEAENPSPMREGGTVAFKPAALRILRFFPDGALDPSFGLGGVVETDFGLPAPLATDGHRHLGSRPSLRAIGVAVDPQGRIIVTGDAVVRLGRSCERNAFRPGVISAGFVARLGDDGAPDPTFGRAGLVGGRHLKELPLGAEVIEEPVVGPGGNVTYRSSSVYRCAADTSHIGIAQLTQTGRARNKFGAKGALVGRYTAITGGSDGSLFALAAVPRREDERFTALVTRFAPDGKLDASFGKKGTAAVKLGTGVGGLLNSLAVDGQGRVLIGGSIGVGKSLTVVLLRVSASGHQQETFGPRGRIATHVPGLEPASALFFDPEGRLVTVHPYTYTNVTNGRSGLVVARYLLRN